LSLAAITLVRGWKDFSRRVVRLSLWMFIALLLALVYPSHQVNDLAWMLIPLWSLAALELARVVDVLPEERRQVIGVTGLTIFILFFVWLQFLALTVLPVATSQFSDRVWLLFGSMAFLVICILLVAVGWSVRIARLGVIWGLSVALGVYSFGALLGAGNIRVAIGQEMWAADKTPAQADLLLNVANEISDWSKDNINAQPVTIAGVDSPALEWLLRGHSITKVNSVHPSATPPPFVITTDQKDPSLSASYRGESFVWRETTLWDNAVLTDWMHWLAYHEMPASSETIIFWVRDDLFLDSTGASPSPGAKPLP
jgi:hypothetical protein